MSFCRRVSVSLLAAVVFLSSFAAYKQVGRYCGQGAVTDYHESFTFDYKVENITKFNIGLPEYKGLGSNNCSPTAGGIVMGYYDIFKPNLIPNYESAIYYNGVYYYDGQCGTVYNTISEIYNLMGTNVGGDGTTLSGFKNGLSNYVSGKGYSLQYESVMQNGLNVNSLKTKLTDGKPVVLFIKGFTFTSFNSSLITATSEEYYGKTSGNRHTCVAYGYRTVSYYRNGRAFRSDTYMLVSFGDESTGYLLMNDMTSIEDAYAIVIQ